LFVTGSNDFNEKQTQTAYRRRVICYYAPYHLAIPHFRNEVILPASMSYLVLTRIIGLFAENISYYLVIM